MPTIYIVIKLNCYTNKAVKYYMNLKKLPALLAAVLMALCACSCSLLSPKPQAIPQVDISAKYVWTNAAHSSFSYNTLTDTQKAAYDTLAAACMQLKESVTLKEIKEDDLRRLFLAVERDYPLINWFGSKYSYIKNMLGGVTVKLTYTRSPGEVESILTEINSHTAILLQDIPPSASDYDKALLAHDALVNSVTYDIDAPNQRTAFGAIVEKKATCEGYAKAYQFLLLRLGIESTLVYGQTERPHAWNLVRLDSKYYHSDATFNDRDIDNSHSYTSHEYLFVDDKAMFKTHSINLTDTFFPLPICDSTDNDYFTKNDLAISTFDRDSFKALTKKLATEVAAKNLPAFQVKFDSKALYTEYDESILATGIIDSAISSTIARLDNKTIKYLGRTFDEKTNVLTFVFDK